MLEGFLVGVLSSFAFWWLIQRLFAPCIKFSKTIHVRQNRAYPDRQDYFIEFWNAGIRRAFDVEVYARFFIEGLVPGNTFNTHIIPIQLRRERIPLMRNDGRKNYASLNILDTQDFGADRFPQKVREAYTQKKLRLENLMNLGSKAELVIVIMAYDEWSGARKVFVSQPYTWDHIQK